MRYLIVKTSAFGDIIHSYCVLEYLKQLDPTCEVDWVAEKRMSSLVKSHPLVSRCIEVDTKKWREHPFSRATWQEIRATIKELRTTHYDAVFDLQGNIKSSFITLAAKAKDKVGYGFKTAREGIGSFGYTKRFDHPLGKSVQCDYLYLVERYFDKTLPIKSTALLRNTEALPSLDATWMVAPGSNWKNKQLTKETLIAFLDRCKDHYKPTYVFLSGTIEEKALAEELSNHFPGSHILYKPGLPLLQHIMANMELVLSMDSLPLHLAGATGIKTFSFFGPTSPQKYRPEGPQHGSFFGTCPYGQTFERRCPKLRSCPTGACLQEASPDAIFSSFQSWFNTL